MVQIMHLILLFVSLAFSYFSELQVPLPVLHAKGGYTFPSLQGRTFVIFGCREAGVETAKIVHKLNATVICATSEIKSFDYTSVPGGIDGVDVMELNFCNNVSVSNFVHTYMHKYSRFPNYFVDLGSSIYDNFNEEELGCSPLTFILNYILLEKELELYNNRSFNSKWSSSLLVANTARLSVYQENFNFYKLRNILDDEYVRRLGNVRKMGLIIPSKASPSDIVLAHLQMLLFIVYDGRRLIRMPTY